MGRGSVGDEAVLAGLLTQYDKDDVIVGSNSPTETHNMFAVRTTDEINVVDVDTLVVAGFVLGSSLINLNKLVDTYKQHNCRVEFRAIQWFPADSRVLPLLQKADYVSTRLHSLCNSFAEDLPIHFEKDFAFYCPTHAWKHPYHGWIGYNAVNVSYNGIPSSYIDISLPQGKILGIAGVRHYDDGNEDDFIAIKHKRCNDYYYTVNPMKMKYLLSTLKCVYTQRKHLALLAHLSGTPTYYYDSNPHNLTLVRDEWGIPTLEEKKVIPT